MKWKNTKKLRVEGTLAIVSMNCETLIFLSSQI